MKLSLLCLLLILNVVNAYASDAKSDLLELQQQWAIANYELTDDEQETEFDHLILVTEELIQKYPNNADFLIWNGIVQSSFAGVKGGLGALSLVKKSRKSLQEALDIDDTALQGSAYTSLGILYHKVPGWPLGFGNDDEAEILIKKALKINPTGIDPNYFYGEFLYDNKKYVAAQLYLKAALLAPARIERPLADKARREEVSALLAKVNKHLDK